jgi:hypothetical protein
MGEPFVGDIGRMYESKTVYFFAMLWTEPPTQVNVYKIDNFYQDRDP